jgi:hypothetical protein
MVHELHKRGFQRLRVMPGMSPSGTSWRCNVTPASNILRTHGAMARDFGALTAHYTSGMENAYFGWEDARTDTARVLAEKFVGRFPEIAEAALGRDWAYVGWYGEMLGIAEQGYLPVAYADWWDPPPPGLLPTTPAYPRGLPMPPGGEADPVADDS